MPFAGQRRQTIQVKGQTWKKRITFFARGSSESEANPYEDRDEQLLDRCFKKGFSGILGLGFLGFGIWLTWYGSDADLEDFLIIGPGAMIIGCIMLTFCLILVIRDTLCANQTDKEQKSPQPPEGMSDIDQYNIPPVRDTSIAILATKELDLYSVVNHRSSVHSRPSRPATGITLRSDGVKTATDVRLEDNTHDHDDITRTDYDDKPPSPVVPKYNINENQLVTEL